MGTAVSHSGFGRSPLTEIIKQYNPPGRYRRIVWLYGLTGMMRHETFVSFKKFPVAVDASFIFFCRGPNSKIRLTRHSQLAKVLVCCYVTA